jgi:hypothetical protein
LDRETLVDKIYGIIFGQAIGDAVGLSTEFMNIKQVRWMVEGEGTGGEDGGGKERKKEGWGVGGERQSEAKEKKKEEGREGEKEGRKERGSEGREGKDKEGTEESTKTYF